MSTSKAIIALAMGLFLFPGSARADSGLKILVEGCNDVDADELGQIVRVDFAEANEGKSTITIACEDQVVSLRMLEAGTTQELDRSVDLSTVDPIARPRTLALLVGELLNAGSADSENEAPAIPVSPPAPSPVKEVKAASKPPVPRPALRQPTLMFGIGLGFGSRIFDYKVPRLTTSPPNLRGYEAPQIPMARLEARAYPFSKNSAAAGLGLSGQYGRAQTHSSQSSDEMSVLSKRSEWDLNLRYQRVLPLANLAAELGLGSQRYHFSLDSTGSEMLLAEVAAVDLKYSRLALDADIPLTPNFGLVAGLEYRVVRSIGSLSERFADTDVSAWAMDLGIHYWITDSIRAQGFYTRSRYSYTFVDADDSEKTMGEDRFTALMLGISIQR